MSRSTSFFILSVSLHAAALVYPMSFYDRSPSQLIQVTILPSEPDGGGAGGQGSMGIPARRGGLKSPDATLPRAESPSSAKLPATPEPEVSLANNVATAASGSVALVSAPTSSANSDAALTSNPAGRSDANGSGLGHGSTGSGNGLGSSGGGFGHGSGGNGNGSGSSGTGVALTQARYRDTPRPEYPASARREGREGSVLLRVLVDEQGRSKKVEINSSSGSAVLDRAAIEALQRWRFHPARYGDQPVEGWLRIPIEFRLADAKP